MKANLDNLNLEILETIKPIPSTDPFFVCYKINLDSIFKDYFFGVMEANHYWAFDGGMASADPNERWMYISFYDNTPDFLIVIQDLLYRTQGDIEAVYSYCREFDLSSEDMAIVYDWLNKVYGKFKPTVKQEKAE